MAALSGTKSAVVPATLINSNGVHTTGDSIYNWQYIIPDHTQPNWKDTVYMIVTRQTPVCENFITDTIKAIVQVNDTFMIDENYYNGLDPNICYSRTDSFYVHLKGDTIGYIPNPSVPQYYNGELIHLEYNKPYSFIDSLVTNSDCDTCLKCDSIIKQVRILRPIYEKTIYDTICVNHLPYNKIWGTEDNGNGQTVYLDLTEKEKEELTRTTKGKVSPKTKNRDIHLQTIYGCDSTIHLRLVVLPVYEIRENISECKDTINPYVWQGHTSSNGRPLSGHKIYQRDEYGILSPLPLSGKISQSVSGTYIFHDSIQTKGCKVCDDSPGCDSVHILTLTVKDQLKKSEYKSLCDDSSFVWRDVLYLGPKYIKDIPAQYQATDKHKRLLKNTHLEYSVPSQNPGICDSLYTMDVTWCPTYDTIQEIHICEGEIYHYRPRSPLTSKFDKDYNWSCTNHQIGVYTLTDTVESINKCTGNRGCDSIVTHIIHVHPVYSDTIVEDICQSMTESYSWEGITESKIWDVQQNKQISPDEIPLNIAGQFTYIDSTRTRTCLDCQNMGCDSILVLKLKISSLTYHSVSFKICKDELPYITPSGKEIYSEGTYTDTLRNRNRYGCDSIITIHLSVLEEIRDTITAFRCENGDPYSYIEEPEATGFQNVTEEKLYYDTLQTENGCKRYMVLDLKVGKTYEHNQYDTICDNSSFDFHGHIFEGLTASENPYRFDSVLQTKEGCDSVVHLYLTVKPTYNMPADSVVLCESDDDWSWYLSDSHDNYKVNVPKRNLDQQPFDTTLTFTLHAVGATQCDSIVTRKLHINPTTINEAFVVWCASAGPYHYGENGGIATESGYYVDTLISKNQYGCDSILHLHIDWKDSIYFYDEIEICENMAKEKHGKLYIGGKYTDFGGTYDIGMYDSVKIYPAGEYHDTITYKTSIGCDSSYYLTIRVLPTHYSIQERNVCQYEYVSYETMHNGAGGIVPTEITGDVTFIDTITALGNGCDSIIHMTYHIRPHYHFSQGDIVLCQADSMWVWYNDDNDPQDTISLAVGNKIYNLGTTYTSIYGCDSTYGISVYVASTYHIYDTLPDLCENDTVSWHGILFAGREFSNYHPNGYDPSLYHRVQSNLTGSMDYYSDTAHYSTAYGCDSIYHLALKVNPVYRKTVIDSICQTKEGYYYKNLNRGGGGILPANYLSNSITINDTLYTIAGCDSIITLHLRVDSVYHYGVSYTFCQDTIETMREWIDEEGRSHGFVLDVSLPGDFNETIALKSIHGCDSTFGVSWHVDPIYRFDTIIHLCENDRAVWQDTLYTGDSVRTITPEDSVILAPGVYHRFKHFTTIAGCDSDYYATIYVHAIYDTLTHVTVCESDGFVWKQEERPNGEYQTFADTIIPVAYCDTIRLLPYEADLPQLKRDTIMRYRERMLQTIYGCDSLSKVWVTVQPTYFFLTDTTICSNARMKYRGKYFTSRDTVYTDHQYTEDGCDSIYQLRLHVRPVFMNVRRVTMCDNETLYQESQIKSDVIWKPGDEIRDPEWEYYDMIYTDNDGCDSIYRYYLTIHPSYRFIDTMALCSTDSILLHDGKYVGERIEFPIGNSITPYNVFYVDTLTSIHGCDSIYGIFATIYPSYRHRDTIIICDDESAEWRGHQYSGYMNGEHIFRDSLYTKEHGCDSIYELHLIVKPTYLFEEHVNKCADEDYTWRGRNFDHKPVGQYFYYDSLSTAGFGCDSVYHLYLTVNDTTREIRHDTICRSEIYDFHGVPLMESGYYYDTTLNEWGCHHYTHLFLHVIEPTVPTVWADSICADEDAYDLFYSYTGEFDPVAYSVLYDEEGHYYGFEDIINYPITTPDELSWLRIPMPLRDNDRTKYPKPNYYNIKLVLDNGICTNPDLCSTDTSIVLNYPSWLTRQRFGDVIALYNEKYNGGYYWSHYQWYHGDTLLAGENHEYLYVPTGLVVGDQYHVRLTREGETRDFQTCPITIVTDPVNNDFAPNMGYLSVVPKCVCSCHKYIKILSRKDGIYRICDMNCSTLDENVFHADVTEVQVPFPDGVYFIQLWSPDTPEEPYRFIKIIISPLCLEHYEDIPF